MWMGRGMAMDGCAFCQGVGLGRVGGGLVVEVRIELVW